MVFTDQFKSVITSIVHYQWPETAGFVEQVTVSSCGIADSRWRNDAIWTCVVTAPQSAFEVQRGLGVVSHNYFTFRTSAYWSCCKKYYIIRKWYMKKKKYILMENFACWPSSTITSKQIKKRKTDTICMCFYWYVLIFIATKWSDSFYTMNMLYLNCVQLRISFVPKKLIVHLRHSLKWYFNNSNLSNLLHSDSFTTNIKQEAPRSLKRSPS